MWPLKRKKVIDLTSSKIRVPASTKISSEGVSDYKDITSSSDSALGFLGSIANASSTNSPALLDKSSPEHLKVRIEDIEYKINALRSRLDKILDRLDLAEKKIDRFDRQ